MTKKLNINLDLKKTKTTDAETFEHMLTVLMCCFFNMHRNELKLKEVKSYSDKEWKANRDITMKIYEKAKKYLSDYIKELIKQKKWLD